jgi:HEAT repeat protein
MSVLQKLASALNRSDEIPNQILAKEIASSGDKAAVQELVENLANKNKDIQSDCIKVLYEIGAIKPELIAGYVDTFVKLLSSRNKRLVWGAMTALGAVATVDTAPITKHIDTIIYATDTGSVITQDWGIRVLAALSAKDSASTKRILPFLIQFLQNCPAKDVPRHAESILPAVNASNRDTFLQVLEARLAALKPAQAKRVTKLIRQIKSWDR